MAPAAPKTVSATWVGPFEGRTPDGTALIPGETVVEVPAGEAEESAFWRPNGGKKATKPTKTKAQRAAEQKAQKAEKAAARKAEKERKAAEERAQAEAEAEAAKARQAAADLEAQGGGDG